jgi:hypothetical protein
VLSFRYLSGIALASGSASGIASGLASGSALAFGLASGFALLLHFCFCLDLCFFAKNGFSFLAKTDGFCFCFGFASSCAWLWLCSAKPFIKLPKSNTTLWITANEGASSFTSIGLPSSLLAIPVFSSSNLPSAVCAVWRRSVGCCGGCCLAVPGDLVIYSS